MREEHIITLRDTEVKAYSFYFADEVGYDKVTYEYDAEMLHLYSTDRSFTVDPRAGKTGVTEIKLIIDDGYTRVEDVYTVEIKEDFRPLSLISDTVMSCRTAAISSDIRRHLQIFPNQKG